MWFGLIMLLTKVFARNCIVICARNKWNGRKRNYSVSKKQDSQNVWDDGILIENDNRRPNNLRYWELFELIDIERKDILNRNGNIHSSILVRSFEVKNKTKIKVY